MSRTFSFVVASILIALAAPARAAEPRPLGEGAILLGGGVSLQRFAERKATSLAVSADYLLHDHVSVGLGASYARFALGDATTRSVGGQLRVGFPVALSPQVAVLPFVAAGYVVNDSEGIAVLGGPAPNADHVQHLTVGGQLLWFATEHVFLRVEATAMTLYRSGPGEYGLYAGLNDSVGLSVGLRL